MLATAELIVHIVFMLYWSIMVGQSSDDRARLQCKTRFFSTRIFHFMPFATQAFTSSDLPNCFILELLQYLRSFCIPVDTQGHILHR